MSESIPWSQLVKQAAEAGIGGEAPLGTHVVEVVSVNSGKTQAGAPKIGAQLKIVEGPQTGLTFWDNLVLTMDNPRAVAAFINRAKAYAGDELIDQLFAAGASVDTIAEAFKGVTGTATVKQGKEKQDGGHWSDIRFKRSGASLPGVPSVPTFVPPQVAAPPQQPTVPSAPQVPAAVATPVVPAPAAQPTATDVPF